MIADKLDALAWRRLQLPNPPRTDAYSKIPKSFPLISASRGCSGKLTEEWRVTNAKVFGRD